MTTMGADERIRVGTRASLLARAQTEQVVDAIRERHPGVLFEPVVIKTAGDAGRVGPGAASGKGFFTREIEEALLNGEVDLAVHSLKDLPVESPAGLGIGAIPVRDDPRDALVGISRARLCDPATASTIGTCSLRRAAQLRKLFPHCRVVPLRGNVDSRLRKVGEGSPEAAVVAAAGLNRLGRGGEASHVFDPGEMLPAPGQGALAVQVRAGDERMEGLVGGVGCPTTTACVAAERAFMHGLGAGCRVPVAALAEIVDGVMVLNGRVISLDGTRTVEGKRSGAAEGAKRLGEELAADLVDKGADEILRDAASGERGDERI